MHLAGNQVRRLAGIEARGAAVADAFQRRREFGLAKDRAGAESTEVLREIRRLPDSGHFLPGSGFQFLGYQETVFGQVDGRRQQILPFQAPQALLRLPHAGHRSGNAGRQRTRQAPAFDDLAARIQVHVTVRSRRGGFAIVDERAPAVDPGQHEAAAAEVAGLRIGDCQRKGGRDSRVDRVSTFRQHVAGHLGAECIRGCDGRLRRGGSTGQWDAFATSRQHGERECRNSAFHEKLHGPRIYTLAAVPGSRYQRSRREVIQASGSWFGGLC